MRHRESPNGQWDRLSFRSHQDPDCPLGHTHSLAFTRDQIWLYSWRVGFRPYFNIQNRDYCFCKLQRPEFQRCPQILPYLPKDTITFYCRGKCCSSQMLQCITTEMHITSEGWFQGPERAVGTFIRPSREKYPIVLRKPLNLTNFARTKQEIAFLQCQNSGAT